MPNVQLKLFFENHSIVSCDSYNLYQNAIFVHYTDSHMKNSIYTIYTNVASKMYASMLEEFDDEKAQKLVHDMVSARIPSVFIQNNIPFTLHNLIKYSFQSISQWSGVYSHFNFYKNANDDLSLIFEHNFGERWSKVLGISFSNLINTMLGFSAQYKAMPNMVSINVKTK